MPITLERGKYRARVSDMGQRVSLGMFDTERKAKLAITRWKKKNEFPQTWYDKNTNSMEFIDMPLKKDRTPTPYKPGFKNKMKAKWVDLKAWVKDQWES